MCSPQISRYYWHKAVLKSDLPPRAKVAASALAIVFMNDETGRCDPGFAKILKATGLSKDTLKRAIRDLIDAGWLSRTEGRGKGNVTRYTLCSPGQIVRFRQPERSADMPQKKGSTGALSEKQKGAQVHQEGGTGALSYNSDKHTYNIQRADPDRFANHRFTGNAFDGPVLVRDKDHGNLSSWGRWLMAEGFPPMSAIPVRRLGSAKKGGDLFALPWRTPPTDARGTEEARAYFIAVLEAQEARHAAQ